jgi:hypothetical protein
MQVSQLHIATMRDGAYRPITLSHTRTDGQSESEGAYPHHSPPRLLRRPLRDRVWAMAAGPRGWDMGRRRTVGGHDVDFIEEDQPPLGGGEHVHQLLRLIRAPSRVCHHRIRGHCDARLVPIALPLPHSPHTVTEREWEWSVRDTQGERVSARLAFRRPWTPWSFITTLSTANTNTSTHTLTHSASGGHSVRRSLRTFSLHSLVKRAICSSLIVVHWRNWARHCSTDTLPRAHACASATARTIDDTGTHARTRERERVCVCVCVHVCGPWCMCARVCAWRA